LRRVLCSQGSGNVQQAGSIFLGLVKYGRAIGKGEGNILGWRVRWCEEETLGVSYVGFCKVALLVPSSGTVAECLGNFG